MPAFLRSLAGVLLWGVILDVAAGSWQTQYNETEPNETIGQANGITLPARVSGVVRYGDAAVVPLTYTGGQVDKVEDLFRFTIPKGETRKVEVTLTFSNAAADLDLMLFRLDPSGPTALAVANGSETTERLSPQPLLETGEYLVGVSAYDDPGNTAQTSYTLSVIPDAASPPPTISGISPVSANAGGTAFSLTINGTNFISGESVIRWNDQPRLTTFISNQQLMTTIAASDIAVAGTAQLRVVNPPSLGGSSGPVSFTILPAGDPEIEVEPNEQSSQANLLLAPGKRAGSVGPGDAALLLIELSNGLSDRVEDLFAVNLTEARRLDLQLQGSSSSADLALYLMRETSPGTVTVIGSSRFRGTFQQITTSAKLPIGRYLVGVSAVTGSSGYRVEARLPGDRLLQAVSSNAAPESTVTIPLTFLAEGDEKILTFSLAYDPQLLSDPQLVAGPDLAGARVTLNQSQTAQGRLGVEIRLPDGQSLPAGLREIARLGLRIVRGTVFGLTAVSIVDQPVARLIYNRDNQLVIGSYSGGSVVIQPGTEGDVSPRPDGSGDSRVTIADWTQAGRFAAGLDMPINGAEFQRADCAPAATLGDGRLTIADWVQAGRYAAGLEKVLPAGGPTIASIAANPISSPAPTATSVVRLTERYDQASRLLSVDLWCEKRGEPGAIALSLAFDPDSVTLMDHLPGSAMAAGTGLVINTAHLDAGRAGLVIAAPPAHGLSEACRGEVCHLLTLRFATSVSTVGSESRLRLADLPVSREIVDRRAQPLPPVFILTTDSVARP